MAVVLACTLAAAGSARTAWADLSAEDIETARAMYKEGKELRAQGDLEGSLVKLRAAHTLAATPITALELGRAFLLVGDLVEARETWLSIERLPVKPDESSKARAARADALKLVDKVSPRIASIAIAFDPPRPSGGPDPVVRVDDRDVPIEALGVARKVNPGHHTVVVAIGRARASTDVDLREGEAKTIPIRLDDEPAADAAPPPPAPTASAGASGVASNPSVAVAPPPPEKGRTSALVYAGLGTAAAGVVVGGVTGILALTRAATVKQGCVDKLCGPDHHDDLDGSRAMGTVSTIAFVAAGAGAALAAIGWLTAPATPSTRNVARPVVMFGGAGIGGEF